MTMKPHDNDLDRNEQDASNNSVDLTNPVIIDTPSSTSTQSTPIVISALSNYTTPIPTMPNSSAVQFSQMNTCLLYTSRCV